MNFFPALWHWIEIHTGTVNESGPYYGFWSGFGSDIGEVTLVAGIIALLRHQNCAHHTCWRLGRHITVDGHKLCRKHLAMPKAALDLPVIHEDHQ